MQIMTREEVLLRDELDRTYARLLEAQAKAAEAPKVDPRQKTLEQEAKAKAAQKDKPSAEGLAEQLKASVSDFEFGVQWTKHLMKAGLDTVGKLVEFIEAGGDLEEATDLSGSQAACVVKKVKEWRKRHAKAMAAAEKEVK